MRTQVVAIGLFGVALLAWAGVSAQQEVRTTPGPGSGMMKVTGSVDISNTPTVEALQSGQWKVSLASAADVRVVNTPRVSFSLPGFLQVQGRYTVTWPGGERETFSVEQLGADGWVRTATDGRHRWINVAVARSIEASN